MAIKAVIFDLDGVIVSTDEYHYQAWLHIAKEEGIPFDREVNEALRGVSRMESLEIMLRNSSKSYSEQEKLSMAERKNTMYRQLLDQLSPSHILPGVLPLLDALKAAGIKIAIGSSSKNARTILNKINLAHVFDAIVDGTDIQNSKPHPEVFLTAAQRLGVEPADCLVVEDAEAGIDAAAAADMKSLGVGFAARYAKADSSAIDLAAIDVQTFIKHIKEQER